MLADKDVDGSGMCVLPGFVDGHTHPVWAGDRVHEFAMKLAGATYLDIHKVHNLLDSSSLLSSSHITYIGWWGDWIHSGTYSKCNSRTTAISFDIKT